MGFNDISEFVSSQKDVYDYFSQLLIQHLNLYGKLIDNNTFKEELIFDKFSGKSGKKPLVTVFVPTLNPQPYLKNLRYYLERQTIKHDVELILFDNGTKDSVNWSILTDSDEFYRIRIYRVIEENTIYSTYAHYRAQDLSDQELVVFLDQDDFILNPDGLENLVIHHGNVNADVYIPKGQLWGYSTFLSTLKFIEVENGINQYTTQQMIPFHDMPLPSLSQYNTTTFKKIGISHPMPFQWGGDGVMFFRLYARGYKYERYDAQYVYQLTGNNALFNNVMEILGDLVQLYYMYKVANVILFDKQLSELILQIWNRIFVQMYSHIDMYNINNSRLTHLHPISQYLRYRQIPSELIHVFERYAGIEKSNIIICKIIETQDLVDTIVNYMIEFDNKIGWWSINNN